MAEIANYKVAASPHKSEGSGTRRIMLDVLIALAPCLAVGTVYYGLYALMLVALCVAACFASEQLFNLARRKPFTFDLSAVVTGVILGLNLPPRAPWYIPLVGGVFAIVVVKMLFGGLGKNFANPAATARVFLLLAYGSVMTSYIGADTGNFLHVDVQAGATYLGGGAAALAPSFLHAEGYWGQVLQLFLGWTGGSIGETCVPAIFAGLVYLLARRVIDWRIPAVYVLTAALMVLICWQSASEILLQLFSGGLLFGAVFMATDYATSPKWRYNRVLYAVGLGVLTVLIRRFGSYPEGTSLAILIMNLVVPVLDRCILPVRFGQTTKAGRPKPDVMKWSMRALCLAMAAALAVSAAVLALQPREYAYIRSAEQTAEGDCVLEAGGFFMIGPYEQERAYRVTIGGDTPVVKALEPVKENTVGYVAELSLFRGKTRAEIAGLTDLSVDSDFSATVTNTALRDMLLECFDYVKYEMGGGAHG